MKVLLTGANGLLGSAIRKICEHKGIICSELSRKSIKLNSPDSSVECIQGYDCVIHAAANTNVEQCELNPEECYRDNVLLTETVARACNTSQTKMVFISSTGVYGEHKTTQYHEYDRICPTTHHHYAKWLAEQEVAKWCQNALIIRTGWLFGGSVDNPKNFVTRRIEEALKSEDMLYSNQEQYGTPCYNMDVAERIIQLLCDDQAGTFNCVNGGRATRLEYVRSIISCAEVNITVKPKSSAAFNRYAKVSNNESAKNFKMDCLGIPCNESLG